MRSLIEALAVRIRRPRQCRYIRSIGGVMMILEAPTVEELIDLVYGLEPRYELQA